MPQLRGNEPILGLNMTGLAIALIVTPHMVSHVVLVPGLSIGRERSGLLFLYLQS
jgi:hypothetical protein